MPTTDQIEWWLKTGSMYGLGFIAIAGFLALTFYGAFFGLRAVIRLVDSVRLIYLPQIVSGHLTFLEHTKVTTATTAQAVEKLTESYGASMDNHSKTHRALACIVKAQQEGDVCDEARKHLADAIRELQ
jgi:hypothetical protein